MRICVPILIAAATAVWAQEPKEASRTVSTYDPGGRRTAAYDRTSSSGPGGSSESQTVTGSDGRRVQLESSEETVISEGPGSRVVERLVKKFDSQGRLTGQEKVRIEETKAPDGSPVTVRATVYDRDLNGRFEMRERTTTNYAKDASAARSESLVERPNVNGKLDLQERKVSVTTGTEAKALEEVTVYRKDQHGAFSPAVRELTEITREAGKEVSNTSQYNSASTGRMELVGQKLSQTVKQADGAESQVVDVFGTHNPGQASSGYNAEPKLRERQLIERLPGPGKGQVETLSIQRPALDSGRLGPAQKISETVCQGNCR
jgi:hypothetical protein